MGLLEQQRYDEAIIRFNDALHFAQSDPDIRFPLMAYMGKAQALAAQGKAAESTSLLRQAMQYVEAANIQVYKADDIFTAELMNQFYTRLAYGMAVGEALTDAKLAMIHRLGQKAVPVLWAGFFVTGDPSATISTTNGSTQHSSIN